MNLPFSTRPGIASLAFVVLATATCVGVIQHQTSGEGSDAVKERAVAPAKPARVLPPVIDPPALASEVWQMPDTEQRRPRFPYLPGEDRGPSRSIGDVVDGYLVDSASIPLPHRHMAVLPVQFQRRLIFTTDAMVALIEEAAGHVAEAFPESIVYLGNFSAEGGGDIPYSVSHNSGRDADVAFFSLDASGQPIVSPNLLPFDDQGVFVGEAQTDYVGQEYHFDVARNWKFVEGLMLSEAAQIQFIFVSNALRRMLLAEARRAKATREVLARAEAMLLQPGGALPHNDHFHIRIFCSEIDVRSGCKNGGRAAPGFRPYSAERQQTIAQARKLLVAELAEERVVAVQRLAVMEATASAREIAGLLDDEDPRVRAASARALANLGTGADALAKRLGREEHPYALVEIVDALGQLGGTTSSNALTAFLSTPHRVRLVDTLELDARAIAANALVRLEDPRPVPALIAVLADDDGELRAQAAKALGILTNHSFGADWRAADELERAQAIEAWRGWYAKHQRMSRDQWLALGFQQAGLQVAQLSAQYVWEICKAISHDDHLSYNAQRVLMRIAGREANSLSWSKTDASFYWRRWFERRWQQYGAPQIPAELSTLR
ncbi:MAG: HEAT repeat domain-containing protein [Bradymonadaceae bacterium]|nr:HEAT repeat domain-containing protein [Lujinxingiaceae bacterium]